MDHEIILGYNLDEISKYVNKLVEIEIFNEILTGYVYTIDPVSRSIILVNFIRDTQCNIKLISFKCVKHITIIKEISKVDIAKLNEIFELSNHNNFTDLDIDERKLQVEAFLKNRMIPVTYTGNRNSTFCLFNGILLIEPPYEIENCQSTNLIVLKQVQKMMKDLKLS